MPQMYFYGPKEQSDEDTLDVLVAMVHAAAGEGLLFTTAEEAFAGNTRDEPENNVIATTPEELERNAQLFRLTIERVV